MVRRTSKVGFRNTVKDGLQNFACAGLTGRRVPGLGQPPPDESTILRSRHLLERNQLTHPILARVNDLLRDKGLTLKAGRQT